MKRSPKPPAESELMGSLQHKSAGGNNRASTLRRPSHSEVQGCGRTSSQVEASSESTRRRRLSDSDSAASYKLPPTRSSKDSRPPAKGGMSNRAMDFELALWNKHSKLMQSRLSAVKNGPIGRTKSCTDRSSPKMCDCPSSTSVGGHQNHSAHSLPRQAATKLSKPHTLSISSERAAPATDEPQELSPCEFVRNVSRKLDKVLRCRHNVKSLEVEKEHRRPGATLCLVHTVPRSIHMAPKSVRGGGDGGGLTSSRGVSVFISSPAFHGALCAVLMVVSLFMGHQLAVLYTNMPLIM